jgi:hypothetical protein
MCFYIRLRAPHQLDHFNNRRLYAALSGLAATLPSVHMSLQPAASTAETSACSESPAVSNVEGERPGRVPTSVKSTSSLAHDSIDGMMTVHRKKKRQRFLLPKSARYVVANSMKHALEVYTCVGVALLAWRHWFRLADSWMRCVFVQQRLALGARVFAVPGWRRAELRVGQCQHRHGEVLLRGGEDVEEEEHGAFVSTTAAVVRSSGCSGGTDRLCRVQ